MLVLRGRGHYKITVVEELRGPQSVLMGLKVCDPGKLAWEWLDQRNQPGFPQVFLQRRKLGGSVVPQKKHRLESKCCSPSSGQGKGKTM